MKHGSIGSKAFRLICLAAALAAVGGLFAAVLDGAGSPVRLAERAIVPAEETAALGREDVATAAGLDRTFQRMGYRLDAVARGSADVPPLFLAQVPADLEDLPDSDTRKAIFLRMMLPLVLAVNEEIINDRARLMALAAQKASGQVLSLRDERWLDALAQRYDVEDSSLRTLLMRVDGVPPSLALAQAAEESGWGTSALARRTQNLFGHTVELSGTNDTGMRNFASLYEAVRAYMHNLNTHRAYEDLRRARASFRARGMAPDGPSLVPALSSYSERGSAYVSTIRGLIRANELNRFDGARLGRSLPTRIASAS